MSHVIINAVIVTYNRKKLLLRCINGVLRQTVKLNALYIIDNASTDGTYKFLIKNGFALSPLKYASNMVCHAYAGINGTDIYYFYLNENIGGAGGFNEGMQAAFHNKSDFIWIMDDDGYPSETCLENQLRFTKFYDYIMPLSLDTDTKDKLTWLIRKKDGKWTRSYKKLRDSFKNGIMHSAVPFNGLLLRRKIIERVGYPKKEMFIWGDDFEYQYRCMQEGICPVTIIDALFYHPADKAAHYRIFFNLISVNYSSSKLRFTCLIRNSTYNYWHYKGKMFILGKFLMYTWFFLFNRKFDFKSYLHYLKCVKDGIKGDFNRHLQFL